MSSIIEREKMKANLPAKKMVSIGFLCSITIVLSSALIAERPKSCKIKDMGGEHPKEICRIIEYLKDFQKNLGQKPPHNIYIIEGDTGIGKTTVSKSMSAEASVHQEYRDCNEIVKVANGSQNTKEENLSPDAKVEKACDEAEKKTKNGTKPVVLIFDDIEAFAQENVFNKPA